jgi:hypothetical protein
MVNDERLTDANRQNKAKESFPKGSSLFIQPLLSIFNRAAGTLTAPKVHHSGTISL